MPQLTRSLLEGWSCHSFHSEIRLILIPRTRGRTMEGKQRSQQTTLFCYSYWYQESLCLSSTLSLLVNIVTALPVSSPVAVMVSYASYKTFDPYWFPGYAGRLARLQQAKELLDDQVSGLVSECTCCGTGYHMKLLPLS